MKLFPSLCKWISFFRGDRKKNALLWLATNFTVKMLYIAMCRDMEQWCGVKCMSLHLEMAEIVYFLTQLTHQCMDLQLKFSYFAIMKLCSVKISQSENHNSLANCCERFSLKMMVRPNGRRKMNSTRREKEKKRKKDNGKNQVGESALRESRLKWNRASLIKANEIEINVKTENRITGTFL